MKTIIRLLVVMAIVAISAGCSASKKGAKGVVKVNSEHLYNLATAALEARCFIVEADGEFYFPYQESRINRTMVGEAPAKTSVGGGNFISVLDNRIEIQFAPKVMPGRQERVFSEQQPITSFDSKLKRNGDHIYTLRTEGDQNFNCYEIIIQLFEGTNQCFVHLNQATGKPNVSFKGKVFPYQKAKE